MTAKDLQSGISVVLPNYNGKTLLKDNLPSILCALNLANMPFEIIVADDCSTDNSVEFLTQSYPEIIIIKTDSNSGFSVTCNKGINIAQYKFTCVTNTDVTFNQHYFVNALKYFSKLDVFAVKGNIINYQDDINNVINTEKDVRLYYKRGFLRFNHNYKTEDTNYDLQFSLLGCCFICKTEIIQALNGYDEIYSPFYWEDSDLALRAIELGYQVIYAPECVVHHKISSTISTSISKRKRQLVSRRNKFLFTWKHLRGAKRWWHHILITTLSFATRWLILDWKFYVALYSAFGAMSKHK